MRTAALDFIERTLFLTQLSDPENLSDLIILVASIAASIKFLLLIATVAPILFFLYAAVIKKVHLGYLVISRSTNLLESTS